MGGVEVKGEEAFLEAVAEAQEEVGEPAAAGFVGDVVGDEVEHSQAPGVGAGVWPGPSSRAPVSGLVSRTAPAFQEKGVHSPPRRKRLNSSASRWRQRRNERRPPGVASIHCS